jgi:hypothetical protein
LRGGRHPRRARSEITPTGHAPWHRRRRRSQPSSQTIPKWERRDGPSRSSLSGCVRASGAKYAISAAIPSSGGVSRV